MAAAVLSSSVAAAAVIPSALRSLVPDPCIPPSVPDARPRPRPPALPPPTPLKSHIERRSGRDALQSCRTLTLNRATRHRPPNKPGRARAWFSEGLATRKARPLGDHAGAGDAYGWHTILHEPGR